MIYSKIHEINQKIKESSSDSASFLNAYVKNEDNFINLLASFNGITSEIYLKSINSLDETLKFSLLFSDLSIVNNTPSDKDDFHASYWLPGEEGWVDRNLTIPENLVNEIGTQASNFLPCYFHRNTAEILEIFNKYSNLIDDNKLFVRPLRGLMVSSNSTFYYVNPNTPNNHWHIKSEKNSSSIILDNGLNALQQQKLFEITLPYFSDIDLDVLLKITNDETDLISGFRSALKKLVNEAANNSMSVKEIQNDILNPEISKLERKFKSIKNIHTLNTIGNIGAFTLSLVVAVVSTSSILNIAPLLPSTVMIATEVAFQNKMSDLKEESMFLLWKISKRPDLFY